MRSRGERARRSTACARHVRRSRNCRRSAARSSASNAQRSRNDWRSDGGEAYSRAMRAAAIQLAARVADVDANLEACERLAERAGSEGAECIVLPEFFTTGIGFVPELADAALAPDGDATEL